MDKIEHLVFEGGGILGLAYSGAIEVLEEKGILNQIKGTAGTSVGAFTAMTVSLGYNSKEISKMLGGMDFESFKDHKDYLRVVTTYGLYKGEALFKWIQQVVANKMNNGNATFADLRKKGCKELKIYACDLNIQNIREFSYQETPNVAVCEAVRASMSIPIFFEAWQFSNNVPNDHLYVDGGTVYNYPIYAYSKESTLGFCFSVLENTKSSGLKKDHLIKYIEALFESMLSAQKINFQHNPVEKARTVIIDRKGVSSTNFALTSSEKEALYSSGKSATQAFIENHHTE